MKTRLFLAALAGVALASCVTDKEYDVPAQNENVKIAFDSPVMYDNDDTRAEYYGEIGEITADNVTYTYPTDEDFVVYAVQHNGDFQGWTNATPFTGLNNVTVSYDSSLDGWAPQYDQFWPAAGTKLSFAASSPADLEQGDNWNGREYRATGLTITNFTIPTVGRQYDLMFSKRSLNRTAESMNHGADQYSGVPIVFQHALSSIHFSLLNKSNATVVLTGISIYGVYNTGNFAENITEGDDKTKYERGDSGNVKPAWTIPAEAQKLSSTNAYVAFSGSLEFPEEAQYIARLLSHDTSNNSTNHVLLLLPQDFSSNDDAVISVNYKINDVPYTKTMNLNTALLLNDDKTISNTAIKKWEMGKKYTYRLYYSAESASQDKIYFSPSSEGWEDAGVGVIELMNTNN